VTYEIPVPILVAFKTGHPQASRCRARCDFLVSETEIERFEQGLGDVPGGIAEHFDVIAFGIAKIDRSRNAVRDGMHLRYGFVGEQPMIVTKIS